MRFFYPALVASALATAVSGIAIDLSKLTLTDLESVAEIVIQEQCRGSVKWTEEGFFRSGTTVRYHGHLWQCTHWNRGENPETSPVWRDLGECDPDAQHESQVTFGKRSFAQNLVDDDDDNTCVGVIDWEGGATYRSGTTVHYGEYLWQAAKWNKGDEPDKSEIWKVVGDCKHPKAKMVKRAECDIHGLRFFDKDAYYRSGTAVNFEGKQYQAKKWVKGKNPTDTDFWRVLDC
ncbi:carbohydrate-binding domain protein [Ceratobasidium sp. AG-Ba]|nr:carbohydrate-binding domain protein [Ceratobasidium sp. AG-Ba]